MLRQANSFGRTDALDFARPVVPSLYRVAETHGLTHRWVYEGEGEAEPFDTREEAETHAAAVADAQAAGTAALGHDPDEVWGRPLPSPGAGPDGVPSRAASDVLWQLTTPVRTREAAHLLGADAILLRYNARPDIDDSATLDEGGLWYPSLPSRTPFKHAADSNAVFQRHVERAGTLARAAAEELAGRDGDRSLNLDAPEQAGIERVQRFVRRAGVVPGPSRRRRDGHCRAALHAPSAARLSGPVITWAYGRTVMFRTTLRDYRGNALLSPSQRKHSIRGWHR